MIQDLVIDMLRRMPIADFNLYKQAVAKVEQERYNEMWYDHDNVDDYIYIVHYSDGHTHTTCRGKQSYNEYMTSEDAVMIERKTKDLFPTYQTLLKKETA